MNNLKSKMKKYKDIIPYAFWGVCTTLVNIITYWLGAHIGHISVMGSTIIAWIVSVLFAYVTNKKWVFKSKSYERQVLLKEFSSFLGCRLGTGIVDWACMWIFVDLLCFDDVIIKVLTNVIVIVLNYVLSKLVIFRN